MIPVLKNRYPDAQSVTETGIQIRLIMELGQPGNLTDHDQDSRSNMFLSSKPLFYLLKG